MFGVFFWNSDMQMNASYCREAFKKFKGYIFKVPVTLQDTTTTRMMAVSEFWDANPIQIWISHMCLSPGGGELSSEGMHELRCRGCNGRIYGPFSGIITKMLSYGYLVPWWRLCMSDTNTEDEK